MTITEFLEARIAEDEAVARRVDDFNTRYFGHAESLLHSPLDVEDPGHDNAQTVGIDPARVLAECAAKRKIIGLHDYEWMGPDDAAGKGCAHDYEDWPCPTIRAVAAIYSDHPDYDQEWAQHD